jgi:hypothetical protein
LVFEALKEVFDGSRARGEGIKVAGSGRLRQVDLFFFLLSAWMRSVAGVCILQRRVLKDAYQRSSSIARPVSSLNRFDADVNNRLVAVFAFAFLGERSTTREPIAFFRKSTAQWTLYDSCIPYHLVNVNFLSFF